MKIVPVLLQFGGVVKFGFTGSFFGSVGGTSKLKEPICNMFGRASLALAVTSVYHTD